MNWFERVTGYKFQKIDSLISPQKNIIVPAGRSSHPIADDTTTFEDIRGNTTFVKPAFVREAIPVIRKLSIINADVSLAVNDQVQLTNTGHIIHFDKSVPDDQIDKMRIHLDSKARTWGDGVAGINGLINKMIAQIWVSGALSIEWVPQARKRGIENLALVNPESIRFALEKGRFVPYQKRNNILDPNNEFTKLNTNTYKYYALNGDTEIPYGIPPFIAALENIATQKDMNKNIQFTR